MQEVFRIRKILAVALLLVLTLGATPKLYIHELFSNHTDYCSDNHSGKIQFSTYKFNCGFVDIEGVSPFLEVSQTFLKNPEPVLQWYPNNPLNDWAQLKPEQTQHRGPPALT